MAIEVLNLETKEVTTFETQTSCAKHFDISNSTLKKRLEAGPFKAFGHYRFREDTDRRRFPKPVTIPEGKFEVEASNGTSVYDSLHEIANTFFVSIHDLALLARTPVFQLGLVTIRRV